MMFLLNNFMVLVKIVMIITLLWYYGTTILTISATISSFLG